MELILWRHADAEEGVDDMDRALTPKGIQQADKVAKWLLKNMPPNTTVLVSPAKRAQQTAAALGLPFKTCDELSPGASPHALLQLANWDTSKGSVLMVGHQPTLGMVASIAMTRKPHYWCVKKANVWWLASRLRMEEDQTIIRAVINPDYL
jgi:phosphohistidine phosphatase